MLVEDIAPAMATNRLNPTGKAAERSDQPLVKYDDADLVTNLLADLKDGSLPQSRPADSVL